MWYRNPAAATDLLLPNVHTGFGARKASYSIGTSFFSGFKRRGMIFTTHLNLVPRQKMRGTVPLLLYILHGVHRDKMAVTFYLNGVISTYIQSI